MSRRERFPVGDETERAISPAMGVVLLTIITVSIAGIVAGVMLGQANKTPAPPAALEPSVDTDGDAVRLTQQAGSTLFADQTQIHWTIDGQRFISESPESHTPLRAGEQLTLYFDGSSSSTGDWTSFGSPGIADIDPSDTIEVSVIDTQSNSEIYHTSFVARDRDDLVTGRRSGDLLWLADQTAGIADETMHVEFTVQENSDTIGNSLNSVEIEMDNSSLSMFSGTSWSNVVTAGVDTTGDGTIDTDLYPDRDDWIIKEGGSHLKVEFGGTAYNNADAGDTIFLTFDGVNNPSPGVYSGSVQTSGDGNYQYDSVETT